MMTVGVRFFGHLRRYAAPGLERSVMQVTLAADTTLDDLLRQLGIPPDDQVDGVVRGEIVGHDGALGDGDEVLLVPALMGGAGGLKRNEEKTCHVAIAASCYASI